MDVCGKKGKKHQVIRAAQARTRRLAAAAPEILDCRRLDRGGEAAGRSVALQVML